MKMLAYDTSSDVLSVALFEGPRRLAGFNSPLFTRHSSALVPAIDRLLRKARVKPKELNCIAVGLGPGSFTGLRVWVTTAKVLSYVTGAKLVGVSSLEIIAAQAKTTRGNIVVLVDARKGKVYAGCYRKNTQGTLQVIRAPALTDAASFMRKIGKPAVVLKDNVFPKASDLGPLARQRIKQRRFIDPFKCRPLYLYPKDCSVIRKREA